MSDFYILVDGDPVQVESARQWGQWFESHTAERIVKQEEIDGVKVSTVFLGLDHSFSEGDPLLYETMIFGGPHNDYQERCSTRAQAVEIHARARQLAFGRSQ